ncbi:MAG TPA: (2Fe-2S) ferredoxin domain-containing protein [Bacteroidales bacterium]|nr:(2Fe-2S) ferredoxin domain-containing protein [Bacteroidales bacterium]HPT09611.1 (2Fe-2S) ferredoxin domain-containing protein [Bacteroidales bacterium]
MEKIKTLADLKKKQDELRAKIDLREKGNTPEQHIQVKVAMATCGIASGAKEVMETFIEEFNKRNIDAVVTQTGCMGYCYAEPTVEITKPGQEPITFGYVDVKKASKLIDKYILNNELVDGIIPVNYQSIDKI